MENFSDVVEAVDQLSPDEQQVLVQILSSRLANHHRSNLKKDIEEARQEFARGEARPMTVQEIMDEVQP